LSIIKADVFELQDAKLKGNIRREIKSGKSAAQYAAVDLSGLPLVVVYID